ncbi:MAG: hypothetical protein Tp1111SUR768151_24 [Prokaryotic dsDNA virus sp.]|nr:MAG: hypothetical protein Tp1111SUR768151_24 [Prokaryotic dsDNA virus sp.]
MQSKIMELLISDNKYRASDNVLLARIWHDHLKYKIKDMSALDLLNLLAKGKLPNHKTITRIRRKLQSQNYYLKDKQVAELRKDLELKYKMQYSEKDSL